MVHLRHEREMGARPTAAYRAPSHVTAFEVAGQAVLHDARQQRLFELNGTADLIWRGLTSGGEAEAVTRLMDHRVPPADAATYVADAARAWMMAGQIAPAPALRALASPPTETRSLVVDGVAVTVAFHNVTAEGCDAVLAGFAARRAAGDRLDVIAHGQLVLFFLNGEILCGCPADGVAAQLKAILTELCLGAVDGGFLAHGALLRRAGSSLFLSGPPGAGKTTLALALAAAGWRFGGDDVVRILPDGRAQAIAFPASVKSGAWPLLAASWPQIRRLPAWRRRDGQTVRYFRPPQSCAGPPQALDAVVLLDRQESAAAAALHPVAPATALQALLESGCSRRWSITGPALRSLADRLAQAERRRLVYSDLKGAVAALEALRRGEA
jgi:hypothetical protein